MANVGDSQNSIKKLHESSGTKVFSHGEDHVQIFNSYVYFSLSYSFSQVSTE